MLSGFQPPAHWVTFSLAFGFQIPSFLGYQKTGYAPLRNSPVCHGRLVTPLLLHSTPPKIPTRADPGQESEPRSAAGCWRRCSLPRSQRLGARLGQTPGPPPLPLRPAHPTMCPARPQRPRGVAGDSEPGEDRSTRSLGLSSLSPSPGPSERLVPPLGLIFQSGE